MHRGGVCMQSWICMHWHFHCYSAILFGHDKCYHIQCVYSLLFLSIFLCDITNKKFPGMSTSTIHLTSTSQPTNTTTSVTLMTQPTKTIQTTRSTKASSVTSSQLNITVVTTSKISFTSVTATSKSEAVVAKTSKFDVGSFVGGIALTLGVLVILYIGCKTYHSRRGIQYRTM
uniref:Porimin n=1 Tax=Buteo japonicus TaxID=224669 RepID=A0A8C0BMQ3_9AVES